MKKRAQAQIITTILLILLVLASILIIWTITNNLITSSKDKIADETACISARDVLSIEEESCFEDVDIGIIVKEISLTAKRNMNNIDITGFSLIVTRDIGSEVFEIIKDGQDPNIIMDEMPPNPNLQIPNQGESKSYIITTSNNNNIKHLEISPTINNNKCAPSKEVEINSCS